MDYRAQIDKYLSYIDSIRKMKGKDYQESGRVEILDVYQYMDKALTVNAKVRGSNNTNYSTKISIKNGEFGSKFESQCSCLDGALQCKHVAAVLYEIKENPRYLDKIEMEEKYKKGKELIEKIGLNDKSTEYLLGNEEDDASDTFKSKKDVEQGGAEIAVKLYNPEKTKEIYVEVYIKKIGIKEAYRIKDLTKFSEDMSNGTYDMYNSKFGITHIIDNFAEESRDVLRYILKHAETLKIANNILMDHTPNQYKINNIKSNRLTLSGIVLDEFFELMQGKKVDIKAEGRSETIYIDNKEKEFKIYVDKKDKDYSIKTNIKGNVIILEGYKAEYVADIYSKKPSIYKLKSKLNKSEVDVIKMTKNSDIKEVLIKESDVPLFVSKVIPKIRKSFYESSIKGTSFEKYMPKHLGVKVLLDYNKKGDVVLTPIYCYDNLEIKPLESKEITEIDSFRDIIAEAKTERIFKNTGFEVDEKNHQYILKSDEDIYRFLTIEVQMYMQKFEVLATNNFKEKEIKRPKIGTLGVKVENNLLKIELSNMNLNYEELAGALKQYKIKKKYYRLKDGRFIDLEQSKDLEVISDITENMNIDIRQIESGNIKASLFRSSYLNTILANSENIEIKKDSRFKEISNKIEMVKDAEYEIPNVVNDILRYYQKVGYNWLKVLDEYNFGGILADDMGLGKTLQIIAVILFYVEKCKKENIKPKPSIVICPSSLSLNWKNEIAKFNAEINVTVVKGIAKDRKEQIKDILNHDLVITSYDLIKRDIEEYTNGGIEFKYIVVDEAQYIKNSNTQNAKTIKRLSGETRYALTGTPIENSLSELWSIFDFILPGYLYGYTKFKNNFEIPIIREKDEEAMRKLKMLIAPFILRRLKKEVLTELPEKTISILNNEMEEEQLKIYNSYLARAKKEVIEELNINGFEKSQMKILSLLTRLRQVCCHPSLFIEGYKGESSKFIQCMELIEEAVESKHKILLFSQYTSMFELIEKELRKNGIEYSKLTGNTKVDDRIKLVDDFNENESIKVFLISLKAGGTGLNLTAADTVIHYDPWWNLSAENQATDRAYRIGQKNAVQVYKLITSGTIEEKIQKMQERKGKLTEDILSNEETFINKLTKEEIMELFN